MEEQRGWLLCRVCGMGTANIAFSLSCGSGLHAVIPTGSGLCTASIARRVCMSQGWGLRVVRPGTPAARRPQREPGVVSPRRTHSPPLPRTTHSLASAAELLRKFCPTNHVGSRDGRGGNFLTGGGGGKEGSSPKSPPLQHRE